MGRVGIGDARARTPNRIGKQTKRFILTTTRCRRYDSISDKFKVVIFTPWRLHWVESRSSGTRFTR